MLFHTVDFAIFLPIVFLIYWFIASKKLQFQNFLILVASYVFYGWWDWRFLFLIFFSTVLDYFVGFFLLRTDHKKYRSFLLWISICVNLGLLGFYKYFNFFIESFAQAFTLLGHPIEASRLEIILPVGISFYTFQTLSYSIDVYRRKITPTQDFIAFAAFVSFFPQLVAGPIERASNLLPQFYNKRAFEYHKATDGLRQILWGLVKKTLIADNCAVYVTQIFDHSNDYSGSTLLIGAFFFAFQIYGDFSGYSDIAIGTSRLFGFELMRNFAYPYFSRDIAEFWRRWHISLSTWFRDYLYIPLGGSRGNLLQQIRNVFIIFIVSGFWHGANWTFIVWGLLNAIYFLPLMVLTKNRQNLVIVAQGKYLPSIKDLFNMILTFGLTLLAWVFFRAENMSHALSYLAGIFSPSFFTIPSVRPIYLFILIFLFTGIEWLGRENQHPLENLRLIRFLPFRWFIYFTMIIALFIFKGRPQEFIYFQF